jgi:LmbE family N-acetylglucosaminyl deacetylase
MEHTQKQKVLVLAPHTDDGELGCGGTIVRLLEEGNDVFYAAFSICEESVPEGFPKDSLEKEVKLATASLGIKKENLILFNYPVRKLNSRRQDILEHIIEMRLNINPDIIFMPCSNALHQDHRTIYEEGMRAFKYKTIYGYDLPWDTVAFTTTAFFKLTQEHIDKKCFAMEFYKTQKFRKFVNKDFLIGLARVRGVQISSEYAEAFEMLRIIH